MSFLDRRPIEPPDEPHDSELDKLLSWGIEDQYGSAKAPDGVWQRIRCELQSNRHAAQKQAQSRGWRTASLAQALAVVSLLVVVGLSLSPALQWPAYLRGNTETLDAATRTPIVSQQSESEPILGDDGLLSGLEIRQVASEAAQQRQVMAKDTSPRFDPILKYRRDWSYPASQTSTRSP